MKVFVLSIFFILSCSSFAISEIYQWVDENGKVVFSDVPRSGDAITLKGEKAHQNRDQQKTTSPDITQHSDATPDHIISSKAETFSIERFYKSSSSYYRVLIKTSKSQSLKCVALDSSGNPLRVTEQHVSPPFDEIIMSTGAATHMVSSVKCYGDRE